MEHSMDGPGAFGDVTTALSARWGKISTRCNHPEHNCMAPFGLEVMVRAVHSYPAIGTRNGEVKRGKVELRQFLDEIALFRKVVLEEVSQELARPLKLEESVRLNAALDALAADALEHLVGVQYRGIEQAVDGQNSFLDKLSHDVRGQLNAVLLTLQLLERQGSGKVKSGDSLAELAQLRRTILATIEQIDRPNRTAATALQNR
jgi:signal transduction histidine kinase